jgi:hypothetical protein
MGLTRIRAEQISDIDYKQAVRVITLSNVTLSGGAPATVDGVNLVAEDRVLVAGQSTGSQNGLYYVQTVGAGSNGTWVRSTDGNETGEIEAGMIVMVTEGDSYKDTQWKLTTNNPIVIGTTALVFEQNSAFAFGNIYANGTAVLATSVGDVLTLTAGNNIQITGNNTSKSVTIGVTGISLTSIANGTSNVNVVSSGGNVTVGVGGTGNIAVFSSTGANITGDLFVSNSIVGGSGLFGTVTTTQFASVFAKGVGGNPTALMQVKGNDGTAGMGMRASTGVTSLIYSNASIDLRVGSTIRDLDTPTGGTTIASIASTGLTVTGIVSASGNVTGGNIITAGLISATGNVTGGNILGNGAGLSGINAFSNIAVTGGNACLADSIADTLTLTAGDGIVLIADAATDTITIAASGSGESIFATGGDMGLVTEAATVSEDLGLVTDAVTESYDLGSIVTGGVLYPDLLFIGDIADLFILGGTNGQYLGTSGDGIMQWQTLDSAPLAGNLAGNIQGNTYSILNISSLSVTNGILNSGSNGVGNIGNSTGYFNTVFAKATSAQYADLAEKYVADAEYTPGTVVCFGGAKEVTQSMQTDHRVAGVVSSNPSYIMNAGLQAEFVVTVALTGRVPTKVFGPVAKGDLMIGAEMGHARACNQPQVGTVIGKSLEDFDGEKGTIEVVVGVR